MKHLVLIAGVYYPQPSPTGKCAGQYISLLKDEYEVDVIFIRAGTEKYNGIKIGSETLYALSDWRMSTENRLIEKRRQARGNVSAKLYDAGIISMKAIGRLQSMVLFPNNLRWFYQKSYKTLCDIHQERPVDVVFTVNSPFAAHLAGEAFKKRNPNVRWAAYTVDPFYAGRGVGMKGSAENRAKALAAEKNVLAQADVNFVSEEVYENSAELYEFFKDKTVPLPYFLPESDGRTDGRFDPEKINLVYAGRFYKDIRNPEQMFQTFLRTGDPKLQLHLYTASDCDALIDRYVKESRGRIIRHDMVGADEIQTIMNSADVLVSLGNAIPEYKPSKTFEYIVTGRPIVNFYQNGLKDEVLEKYPLSLQLSYNISDIDPNAEALESFCLLNNKEQLEREKIKELFGKYSAEQINKMLINKL